MQLFNGISRDQQQAILQRLGRGGGSTSGMGGLGSGSLRGNFGGYYNQQSGTFACSYDLGERRCCSAFHRHAFRR